MAVIQVPPDSTGKKVDTVTLSDAGSEVHRQKMVVTGGSGTAEVVAVMDSVPAGSEMGMVVRHAGTAQVALAGKVAVSGTAIVAGVVVISSTAIVAGSVVISGTATVAGVVGLTAGTANIGHINHISRTVEVVGSLNIGAITAGTSNIGFINHISATTIVAGNVNLSATANVVGALNISGSVVVSGAVNLYTTAENVSASRGPRCVIASTSANVTLVAAPGAGMSIFVTQLGVSNASGSNTRARAGTSATIGNVTMMMAGSGGGFVMQFTPPWQLSANEAMLGSVKPNASEGIFNVMYFVGSADAF